MSKHRTSSAKIKNTQPSRTTTAFPHKVKLIDLCPQEKAKVGQLMLLMEKEKTENYELKKKIMTLEQQNQTFEATIHTLEKKIDDMTEEIKEIEHKLQAALTVNKKKQAQVQQLMKVYERYVNRKMAVGSVQTDEQHQSSFGTQVDIDVQEKKKKKKKCRNVKVQTETAEIVKRHSKSFEKIMRSNDELIKNRLNMRQIGKSQAKSGKSIGQSAHSLSHHSSQHLNTNSDNQQSAEMLAKAWQQLKKHKLSQNVPEIPQQNSRQRKQSELQYSQESSQKVVQKYLKLRKNHDQKQYTFNDEELNRQLKSKQFQARRLLESIKKSDRSQESQGRLEFYETNLLDIVNSIAK